MTQDEINRQEWARPEHWSGGVLGIYRSARDTRVWVPKRNPALGWTLNFAHRRSWVWLAGLLVGPLIAAAVLARFARPRPH